MTVYFCLGGVIYLSTDDQHLVGLWPIVFDDLTILIITFPFEMKAANGFSWLCVIFYHCEHSFFNLSIVLQTWSKFSAMSILQHFNKLDKLSSEMITYLISSWKFIINSFQFIFNPISDRMSRIRHIQSLNCYFSYL